MTPNPFVHKQQLRETQEKLMFLLVSLGLVSVLLCADLLFVETSQTPVLDTNSVTILTFICVLLTGFVAYKYKQNDLNIKSLSRDHLYDETRSNTLRKSKDILRRASQESTTSKGFARRQWTEPVARIQQQQPVYTPNIQTPQINFKNIRPYDFGDDIAENFIQSKNLQTKIRTWIQNIRMWYSKDILPHIIANHIENLQSLNRQLHEITKDKPQKCIFEGSFDDPIGVNLTPEEMLNYQRVNLRDIEVLADSIQCNYTKDLEQSKSFSISGQPSYGQIQALFKVKFKETIQQRKVLEKYFEVPGYSSRGYVLQRLHELVRSSCLAGYTSYAGGSYYGDSWTPKRPTDAHILSNIFFRILNNCNNPNPVLDSEFSMMKDIIVSYPEPAPYSDEPQRVCFYQKNPESSVEPHYDIVAGRETLKAYSGNENLFCAIALFLLRIKDKNEGYFYHMNCQELFRLIS